MVSSIWEWLKVVSICVLISGLIGLTGELQSKSQGDNLNWPRPWAGTDPGRVNWGYLNPTLAVWHIQFLPELHRVNQLISLVPCQSSQCIMSSLSSLDDQLQPCWRSLCLVSSVSLLGLLSSSRNSAGHLVSSESKLSLCSKVKGDGFPTLPAGSTHGCGDELLSLFRVGVFRPRIWSGGGEGCWGIWQRYYSQRALIYLKMISFLSGVISVSEHFCLAPVPQNIPSQCHT